MDPGFWGYIATVTQRARNSDKLAFSLKFHDSSTPFYFAPHPGWTEEEKARGCAVRYLTNPEVKVLALGRAS